MFLKKNHRQPRAEIKWPVVVKTDNGKTEGVAQNVSEKGAFIRCARPLGLNEIIEMVIEPDQEDREIQLSAEVVWTNIHGPDDDITPRGMGVLFTKISNGDRDFISQTVSKYSEAEGKEKYPDEDQD